MDKQLAIKIIALYNDVIPVIEKELLPKHGYVAAELLEEIKRKKEELESALREEQHARTHVQEG